MSHHDHSKPSSRLGRSNSAAKGGPPVAATNPTSSAANTLSPAQLAHELANLLDGGLRNLSLAMHSLRDPQQVRQEDEDILKRLNNASQAMQQMAALVQHMLDPHHRPALQTAASTGFTLAQAVEHAVSLLRPIAHEKQIEIRVNLAAQASTLSAGPLYPVLINALRNSLDALLTELERQPDPGFIGIITITAHCDAQVMHLSVQDNGPGLSAQLFDEQGEFRYGKTTKTQGHGLGLSLCREIARILQGQLTLSNLSPRGCVLSLRFPLQALENRA